MFSCGSHEGTKFPDQFIFKNRAPSVYVMSQDILEVPNLDLAVLTRRSVLCFGVKYRALTVGGGVAGDEID